MDPVVDPAPEEHGAPEDEEVDEYDGVESNILPTGFAPALFAQPFVPAHPLNVLEPTLEQATQKPVDRIPADALEFSKKVVGQSFLAAQHLQLSEADLKESIRLSRHFPTPLVAEKATVARPPPRKWLSRAREALATDKELATLTQLQLAALRPVLYALHGMYAPSCTAETRINPAPIWCTADPRSRAGHNSERRRRAVAAME